MTCKILTQERLKQKLIYFPDTGIFIWKELYERTGYKKVAGTLHLSGYQRIQVDRKIYNAHRLAWLYAYGHFPCEDIDHVNRIRSDNRLINLREVTRAENMQNIGLHGRKNSTGFLGVRKTKHNRWNATIRVDGKPKNLGNFKSAKEAHNAYLCEKRKSHPMSNL